MFADIRRHKLDYSFLAFAAAAYIYLAYSHQSQSGFLLYATYSFSGAYFLWGVWHHLHTKTLTGHIVLEYFLVALLAVAIVSTLLV